MEAAEAAVARPFGGARLTVLGNLGGSDRSVVVRAAVEPGPGRPPTVVVKAYDLERAGDGAVREPAALGVLRSISGRLGPELLATVGEPPLVVLSDLGQHESLADRLRGHAPRPASEGVEAWAATMAALHVATRDRGRDFESRLGSEARRFGIEVPATDDMSSSLSWVAETLEGAVATIGVTPSDEAIAELVGAAGLLGGEGEAHALTPADACPDNNLLEAGGLVLLDFEHADYRHVAWDAAYLTVPWPSCWCAWAIPEDLAERALDRWRRDVAVAMPYVATPAFDRDLEIAGVVWSMISCAWFLERARDGESSILLSESSEASPDIRSVLQHRLRLAAASTVHELGAVRRLAAEMLEASQALWGERELQVAAAFLGGA